MLLDAQAVVVVRFAYYQLRLVCQLFPFLGAKELTLVTHALATPRLDCCNMLYMGLSLNVSIEASAGAKLLLPMCWLGSCQSLLFYASNASPFAGPVQGTSYDKALQGQGLGYRKDQLFRYMPA